VSTPCYRRPTDDELIAACRRSAAERTYPTDVVLAGLTGTSAATVRKFRRRLQAAGRWPRYEGPRTPRARTEDEKAHIVATAVAHPEADHLQIAALIRAETGRVVRGDSVTLWLERWQKGLVLAAAVPDADPAEVAAAVGRQTGRPVDPAKAAAWLLAAHDRDDTAFTAVSLRRYEVACTRRKHEVDSGVRPQRPYTLESLASMTSKELQEIPPYLLVNVSYAQLRQLRPRQVRQLLDRRWATPNASPSQLQTAYEVALAATAAANRRASSGSKLA
jgi:hypothetical protein